MTQDIQNNMLHRLHELMSLPSESEWVEFKEAKYNYNFDDIGKYFSALSNEANLNNQPAGWLVFGVSDKPPRQITGSNYRSDPPGLEKLKKQIAQRTNHQMTFRNIYEIFVEGKRVILFEIPPASRGIPTTWGGIAYGRTGDSLTPLTIDKNVIEEPDSLLFTNLGDFLPGSVEEVIRRDAPPELYRNRFLAEAMVNLNMIDTIGSGIKRMFTRQRERFFPMPDYDLSTPGYVKVRIIGKVIDERYTRMLIQKTDLSLEEVIALDKVQKGKPVTDEEFKMLKRKGLIEGRRPNLFVSAKIAEATDTKAEYIKKRAFDKQHYTKMVQEYLEKFSQATRKDIDRLLLDKISDALSHKQKIKFVSNLLQEMRRQGVIYTVEGKRGRGAVWKLSKDKKIG